LGKKLYIALADAACRIPAAVSKTDQIAAPFWYTVETGVNVPLRRANRRYHPMGDKRANKDKQSKRRVKAVATAQTEAAKAVTLTRLVERKKK
jgi:hypothetical protein